MRTNAGYTITDSVHVGDVEFVLGEQENGKQFVTWECKAGNDYCWGHQMDIGRTPTILKAALPYWCGSDVKTNSGGQGVKALASAVI